MNTLEKAAPRTAANSTVVYDVIVIGAGPTGLACAIEAKRAGLHPLVIDKGCLCNSLYHYPTNMVFFTTPERMEIGDLPMTTLGGKPTRAEALKYYRRAAEHYGIEVAQYQRVEKISGHDGNFIITTREMIDSDSNSANASDSENDFRKGAAFDPERSTQRAALKNEGEPALANDFRKGAASAVPNDARSSAVSTPEVGRSARPSEERETAALHEYHSKKLILATGYYDLPNFLNVPGENLPHVSHYFTDPHPYWNKDVVVIGAKNSAAEAALDLFRGGARVTLVHRGAELGRSLKYWVRPDIENRIRAGEIHARFNAKIERFEPGKVVIQNGAGREELPAFHVFAMTGYHPDFSFLEAAGIRLGPKTRKPELNPKTLESNVPGIYVAGVLVGGIHTGEIFIENGRFHGRQIVAAIGGREGPREPAPVSPPGE